VALKMLPNIIVLGFAEQSISRLESDSRVPCFKLVCFVDELTEHIEILCLGLPDLQFRYLVAAGYSCHIEEEIRISTYWMELNGLEAKSDQ